MPAMLRDFDAMVERVKGQDLHLELRSIFTELQEEVDNLAFFLTLASVQTGNNLFARREV